MPLVRYREPQRGDVVVFLKPGYPDLFLVKRLIAVPGDRLQLRNGIVIINGVAQAQPHAEPTTPENHSDFLDEFPSVAPMAQADATPEAWAVDFPNYVKDGDLVVPPGKFFMMGDNRHDSLDSRYWGFVPRENIVGRPLFNYWSFETPERQYEETGLSSNVAWMAHVALHFFTETRWSAEGSLIAEPESTYPEGTDPKLTRPSGSGNPVRCGKVHNYSGSALAKEVSTQT
jgi:signal peptidase I